MKNIGLLEIHYHVKFLYSLMRICKTKNTKVTVFTTREIFSRIETYLEDKSQYEVVLKEDKESINHYLKRVEKICNEKIDILFVNTIELSLVRIPYFFRFKPKSKMILTIHIITHWLKKRFTFDIMNIFRSMDTNISIYLARRLILPKYDAINVVYPPLKNHVEEKTRYNKPVFKFPFNFFDEGKMIPKEKKDGKIRFVIPGLVEEYRRNYDLALDVFEKLFEKYGENISLYVLGEPIGKGGTRIIKRCEKLKENGYDILFSKGFIPEEKYNKALIESDVIFSPLNVVTKRDTGIKETYGKTEGSALPFEAIQYVKPLIVPEDFNVDELTTSSIKYSNIDDLEKKLIELITNKSLIDVLTKNALTNSKKYSLPVLQNYFENNLLNI